MFLKEYMFLYTFICVFTFICKSCSSHSGDIHYVPAYLPLGTYKFSPTLGECHVLYAENEIESPFTCQRPANPERQACIELIVAEKHCLVLRTPRNETVEFVCKNTKEEVLSGDSYNDHPSCFKVYSTNGAFETICQEIFKNETVGIKTPSNFIILFTALRCPISTRADERIAFSEFVNNFAFEPDIRSCYKIFEPHQVISPHSCLSKDIKEYCVEKLDAHENCIGIITPNNETVILDCTQEDKKSELKNCFKIYTSDNVEYMTCTEILEERCVGFTTPSNLTILLECYYCYAVGHDGNPHLNYYDPEYQRRSRKFVKTYIDNEQLGKNLYLDKIQFEVYGENQFVKPVNCRQHRAITYTYWLPYTKCFGITLQSNETVILQCESEEKHAAPGCFEVVNSDMEHRNVCLRVLDEICVGIITPQNITVSLTCYSDEICYGNSHNYHDSYAKKLAEKYQFRPMLNTCYELYNSNQDVVDGYSCRKKAHPENYSCIDWIPGEKHCLGLKTPNNELIEFLCGNSKEEILKGTSPIKACFKVYNSDKSIAEVCQKKFGKHGIGITTPSNFSILIDSEYCTTSKTTANIKVYKEFVNKFRLDPNVERCYKVYEPRHEVSPYTCFSREASDSCVRVLERDNCMGITTYNNETVVLSCFNDTRETNETECFQIYTADGQVHRACQEKLEESCVGITTPSNLRILFDCHTCKPVDFSEPKYNSLSHVLRKTSLDNFNQGKRDFSSFYSYKPAEHIYVSDFCFQKIGYYETHLLRGYNNCHGITMENLETIILKCPDEEPETPGCFDVYSPTYGDDNRITGPKQKVQKACVKIVDRICVGIVTPGNRTLPLQCTPIGLSCVSPIASYLPNNKPPLRQ